MTASAVLLALVLLPGPPAGVRPRERDAPRPRLVCPAETIDFGRLYQGEAAERPFVLENRGDAPLVVKRVNPRCGCTVARYRLPEGGERNLRPEDRLGLSEVFRIPAGGRAEIVVRYDSTGQPIGALKKHVEIATDDPDRPWLVLTLTVEVRRSVTVDPKPLRLPLSVRGRGASAEVRVTPAEGLSFRVVKVENLGELLRAEIVPPTEDEPTTVVRIDLSPKAPVGLLSRTLLLQTDDPRVRTVRLPVFAEVRAAVRFDTGDPRGDQAFSFGVVAPGREASRTIDIVNEDPAAPYRLRSARLEAGVFADRLRIETETLEEGRHYRVRVTCRPRPRDRFFRGVVVLEAEHPDVPVKRIVFSGRVRS